MRNTTYVLAFGLLAIACGSRKPSTAGTTTTTPTSAADQERPAQANLRLGHYSTGDGLQGLVLDRTSTPIRARFDGSKDVIELTPRAGNRTGETRLLDPKGNTLLEIDDSATVTLFTERGTARLIHDGHADPLPAATIAGQAPEPPADPRDVLAAALTKQSAMVRHGVKSEDAGDLGKVAAVFAKMDAAMFVHTARDIERDCFRPSPRKIGITDYAGAGGYWPADEPFKATATGLRKHGGVPLGTFEADRPNWIKIHRPDGYPPALRANTPGVVWEVDGGTVWFVAFDGGRYSLELDEVASGLPAGSWAAPMQHTLLNDDDVDFLGRTGAMPKAAHEELERINQAFNACTADGWKGFDRELETLAAKDLSWSTRSQRAEIMARKRKEKVEKTCTAHVQAFDAALVKLVEQRTDARSALFEKAKARAAR